MKILYRSKKVKKDIDKLLNGSNKVTKKIEEIIKYFTIAKNFSYILNMKNLYPHQLTGDRDKQWSVKVDDTKYRVIFYLCDEENNPITEKSFDITNQAKNLKTIIILEVSDDHYKTKSKI